MKREVLRHYDIEKLADGSFRLIEVTRIPISEWETVEEARNARSILLEEQPFLVSLRAYQKM